MNAIIRFVVMFCVRGDAFDLQHHTVYEMVALLSLNTAILFADKIFSFNWSLYKLNSVVLIDLVSFS